MNGIVPSISSLFSHKTTHSYEEKHHPSTSYEVSQKEGHADEEEPNSPKGRIVKAETVRNRVGEKLTAGRISVRLPMKRLVESVPVVVPLVILNGGSAGQKNHLQHHSRCGTCEEWKCGSGRLQYEEC